MRILGIVGGVDLPFQRKYPLETKIIAHDASAVLIEDGKVVAAIEEERLNRIKHTDKAPIEAMRFCLKSKNYTLKDIDKIAVYGIEKNLNQKFKQFFLLENRKKEFEGIRDELHRIIIEAFGEDIDDSKIVFVPHHIAHVASAYYMSGFKESLVLSIDGEGDGLSALVVDADSNKQKILNSYIEPQSLGHYYVEVINYLGYDIYDEYKVMGLAPYGDPEKYRKLFKKFYTLLPNGKYKLNREFIPLLFDIALPRRKGEPFNQIHKDIAAALQETVEGIILHILKYYQEEMGHRNLCLAGGVAHNCSAVGKIMYSGMFDNIFVQPAAHDAGCALGAALQVYHKENPNATAHRISNVYWGTDIGEDSEILKTLTEWDEFIHYEYIDKITEKTAELLAEGAVIGWVQGKSEFGPRALGNRSIIADPRPEENKDIINEMVKKREGYRPFAPSILEDCLDEYYDIPIKSKSYPFMNFVVKVKEDKKNLLRAVTHVDSTARIQTVSANENQRYAELIEEFRKKTGIPILLNTSFNNNAEPIVDSPTDAIVCYLTTKLNYLVIGNYLINKKEVGYESYLNMIPIIPLHTNILKTRKYASYENVESICEIGYNYDNKYNREISNVVYAILELVDGNKSLNDIINELKLEDSLKVKLTEEIVSLWTSRLIQLKPKNKI